ncbi:hypothetical protein [Pseudalkalibacillus berkeleyi]|uniref:Uncharacterized protein n=1 Tax=Pseudalkalibacillus berkeleyi TaxID=1069813 RepID=A0ABS9GU52_9BACL|nr:hypothetical protein [Pseudalkalibacillus berkeleyi]MCF6136209.1 hypothetical protein [Pseudalkalibacillus berkeleyi]
MDDQFKDDLAEMRETGEVYRNIVEQFGDQIEVIFVDPRNSISIMDYMFRQLRKRKINVWTMLKNTFVGSRRGAIFLNGHWLNSNARSNEDIYLNISEELGVHK